MKKAYTTPMLALSGRVVSETLLCGPNIGPEGIVTRVMFAGAIGYYL